MALVARVTVLVWALFACSATNAAETRKAPSLTAALGEPSDVERFCSNIATGANEARLAFQMEQAALIEKDIEDKTAKLDSKIQELKALIAKRDDFLKRSEEATVAIFAKMRPDAAALQLISMDERSAASVVSKLNPRSASLILAEMDPGRAARLAEAMATSGTNGPGGLAK